MDSRRARQIKIAAVILTVAAVGTGSLALYLNMPAPSCSDGVRNYGEEDVDCGGSCPRSCTPGDSAFLQSSSVVWFLPQPGRIAILGEIRNPNPQYAAASVPYRFILRFNGGQTQEYRGSTAIKPGRTEHVWVLRPFPDGMSRDSVAEAQLVVDTPRLVPVAEYRSALLHLTGIETAASDEIRIRGEIVNSDRRPVSKVHLAAVLYDEQGDPVGLAETTIDDIRPRGTRSFLLIHPFVPGVDPARTIVYYRVIAL
jgi:hypothetical protein